MMADGVAHQLIVGLIVAPYALESHLIRPETDPPSGYSFLGGGRWFIDAHVQSFDSGYVVTTAS